MTSATVDGPSSSPVHAALWSQPTGPGSKARTTQISTPVLGIILLACLVTEMLTDVEAPGEGLLSSHNGLLMKFFKSLHAINHCAHSRHKQPLYLPLHSPPFSRARVCVG